MSTHPMSGAGKNMPRLVFWEVTKGCNLRCVHCRATATELSSPKDLPTAQAINIIDQIADFANPILVLSGGEPLYRSDIFDLASHATSRGLRVALATNGTLVTKEIAKKVVDAGVKRVSISLDGSNAHTHDTFRQIPGSFDAAVQGFRNLKELGMPVQINMTIAKHNAVELPKVLDMVRNLGADALHTFLLVPVGCGVDIADSEMVDPQEYERILNWFYDQAAVGDIELKATCAPHYFRVVRQRRTEEARAERAGQEAPKHEMPAGFKEPEIGPLEMAMPGTTGVTFKTDYEKFGKSGLRHDGMPHQHPHGHPGGDPNAMNAMTKGCLAGTGVCFISFDGEVFPCGYLPAIAGDLKKKPFAEVWNDSKVFNDLRDTDKLEGKCGCCEFRNVCMGCRARAYAANGNYMSEEPFCVYQPKPMTK
ncbi:MAG: radical SAM protein [Acidobacteriota bacterium]|nr:radical SAM protein [Acidobacteriota bacterium]